MTQTQIDKLLVKMQKMKFPSNEYSMAWGSIIIHYNRMIYGLCKNRKNIEDKIQECYLRLPYIIPLWQPKLGAFSTYLTWSLRSFIQRLGQRDSIIVFNPYHEKEIAVRNNREERTYPVIYLSGKAEERNNGPSGEDFYLPPVLPDIESKLETESMLNLIKHIKNSDMWIDYYINEISLVEIGKKYHSTHQTSNTKIKKVHETILALYSRLMGVKLKNPVVRRLKQDKENKRSREIYKMKKMKG